MTEEEKIRGDMETKLKHLTFPGASDFWGEIKEWLDALISKCEKKYDRATTFDEFKEAQIMKKVCQKLRDLPEKMAIELRQLLAEPTPGETKSVEEMLNFIARPEGVKQEDKNG